MGFFAFVGRVLIAIIFIGAGVSKFQQPEHSAGFLNSRYPPFAKVLDQTTKQYLNHPLPEQLQPKFIQQHSKEIILGVGGAEIGLGLLVILNQAWAGKLLALITLSFIAVIHNPILHGQNPNEKLQEQIQAFWTLGIAGALLLVGGGKQQKCVPQKATGKQTQKQTTPTPQGQKKPKRN